MSLLKILLGRGKDNMLLRGFAIDGEAINFSLNDAPIVLTDTLLVLSAVPESKQIRIDSVVRGDEGLGVFEGDELVNEGGEVVSTIYYAKGFVAQDIDIPLKKLLSDGHIKVRTGTIDSVRRITCLSDRSDIVFGYNKKIIFFRSILAKLDGHLCFVDDQRRVSASDVSFYSGWKTDKGENIFYGDFYRGGTVVMRDGCPKIEKLNGDLKEMEE
jgi:hypothetical protein